jgi:hypothetical protein
MRLLVQESNEYIGINETMVVGIPKITFKTNHLGSELSGNLHRQEIPENIRTNLTSATLELPGLMPLSHYVINPKRLALFLAHHGSHDTNKALIPYVSDDPTHSFDCSAFVALLTGNKIEDLNDLPLREGPYKPGDILAFFRSDRSLAHLALALPERTISKLGTTPYLACLPEKELLTLYECDRIQARIPIR